MDIGSLQPFGLSEYSVGKKWIKCQRLLSNNSLDFTDFVLLFPVFSYTSLSILVILVFFPNSFPTLKEVINITFYAESEFSQKCSFAWMSKETCLSHFPHLIQWVFYQVRCFCLLIFIKSTCWHNIIGIPDFSFLVNQSILGGGDGRVGRIISI